VPPLFVFGTPARRARRRNHSGPPVKTKCERAIPSLQADADLLFHDALSGASTAFNTRRKRSETARGSLGTGVRVPAQTGATRRKQLDFAGFCMAMESIAVRLSADHAAGVPSALRVLFDEVRHDVAHIIRMVPLHHYESPSCGCSSTSTCCRSSGGCCRGSSRRRRRTTARRSCCSTTA
jgi:hypothetical protein